MSLARSSLPPLLLSLVVWCGDATARPAEPPATAASAQQVHPVLIRNEVNAVAELVVKVATDDPLSLRAVRFTLDGTDDLDDIESLELLSGEKAPRERFGGVTQPARSIEFRGDLRLNRGENVFRLSCRLRPDADLSHHVGAIGTEVETGAGRIAVEDRTPGRSHRIGVALRKQQDDGVHTYRIPVLATTSRGTLLCAYDMRRRASRDLQEDIDVGLSRGTDGGRTWEPVRVIVDMGEYGGLPQAQNGCGDPGILVDYQTGEIFVFALWMHAKPGKHQWTADGAEPGFEIGKTAQFLMVRSRDDGRSWSAPANLTRALKQPEWWLLAPSPQAGIQLPDGTLVMPIQGRDEKGEAFCTIMTSGDHGASWTVGAPAYRGGNECQAARLGDGSIMLNIRNNLGPKRAVAVTSDLGRTWREHPTSGTTLIEPRCNASLLRVDLPNGREPSHVLLFANPHAEKARTHQTIQVSFDDGRTWPRSHHRLLDEGRGAGYPSLARIDDDHIGIVYEGSGANLVFERLSLAELLNPSPAGER